MRLRLRKTVRLLVLLSAACFTFIVGLSAFYFYAEAAAFLFTPKQSATETTQLLTAQTATPPFSQNTLPPKTYSSTPSYQYPVESQPACENCIQDELCGLCEQVKGEYENDQFSYMLSVPDELQAMRAPAPAVNNGFIARLYSDPEASLEVEGTYNGDSWNSLNEAVNAHIDYLKASAKEVVVLKRNAARLGKRTGIRYVVQYTSLSTGQSMIEDKIIAFRKEDADSKEWWTVYAVSLQTPQARYEKNIVALEKLLKRWKELESGGC